MRQILILILVVYIAANINDALVLEIETLTSTENCCSITINHTQQTVTYKTQLGTDIEAYSTPDEMDEVINSMMEFCYHEHGADGHEY